MANQNSNPFIDLPGLEIYDREIKSWTKDTAIPQTIGSISESDILRLFAEPIDLTVGTIYTLGSGAKTNKDNSIQAKCLAVNNGIALMQTYGITYDKWPGADLSSYNNFWGNLISAISDVKLPEGTNAENLTPDGSYEILTTTAANYEAFDGYGDGVWTGTTSDESNTYFILSNGNFSYAPVAYASMIIAPYFNLDLYMVQLNNDIIEIKA